MCATQWQFFCLQLCAHFLWLISCDPIAASSSQGRHQWTYRPPGFAQWNDFKAFAGVLAQLYIALQLTNESWIHFRQLSQVFCWALQSSGGLIFLSSHSCLSHWFLSAGPAKRSRMIEWHRNRRCGWFDLLSRRTQCPWTKFSSRGRWHPPALRAC
jgi:hypothetical protein